MPSNPRPLPAPVYRAAEVETQAAANHASAAEPVDEEEGDVPAPARRSYRQEEARLVTYVVEALETVYASEYGPERETIFDVHNQRPGNAFENVDVIAAHWRSDEVVDLISVEVKLDFTPRLVQQANNYRRFSHRVWIAVPVAASLPDAASKLQETDPLLFDYIVELGIGVLACRRGRGRSYEVAPIHWPRLLHPDPVERDAFLDRHRVVFEDAGIIAPAAKRSFPRLR